MVMTLAKLQSAHGISTPIQQIYITHCLREEGLYRQAGFAVRATSTLDPLLLRFAQEYPTYELPVGLTNERASLAPRRLALVRIPGGRSALIHSVPLKDDSGRANNFFSHVLIRPHLTAREALACWGASAWRTSGLAEEGTDLPPLDDLPIAERVTDDAVTAFLAPDTKLLSCPSRLVGDVQRRRQLVRLALRGCTMTMQVGATAARGRFYLLAEPELTALLLYAAVRLMPDALAANLTFSTYENAHRDLRAYKHTRVVGTMLAEPSQGLDGEFFSTRGLALDTFGPRYSPELDDDSMIDEWIDLAARGDWPTIDNVQRLLGKTNTALMPFSECALAAKISVRASKGKATGDDLLTLKRSAWGAAIVEEHRDKLWAMVRASCPQDERVRREYADVLREHLPEIEREIGNALAEQPPGDWQSPWRLLCSVLANEPAQLRETLGRLLPEPPYSPALRLELMSELERCELSPLDSRVPWHTLLKNCTSEDLDHLAQSALPREWFAVALLYAFARLDSRAAAAKHLHRGDDDLFALFWEQFRLLKDESQRRAILASLFPIDQPEGVRFLDRFLIRGVRLRVETLEWLLDGFGAFGLDNVAYWGRDNRIGMLLELLRSLGDDAIPLWDRLCGLIDPVLLAPGNAYQETVLMELAAVNDRPGPPLPRKTAQTLADWILLREHFERATDVPEGKRRQIIDACNRQHFEAIDVLGRYFERFVLPQGMNEAVLADFAGFFHSFFLAGMGHQDCASRLIAWLQIVSCCGEEARRIEYQLYYVRKHVPLEFRYRLAEETRESGRLLPAVFDRMQKIRPEEDRQMLGGSTVAQTAAPLDELFQLSGVRATDHPSTLGASLRARTPWLLGTMAGGLLAAMLIEVYKVQFQRVAAMVLFVPLVLALAESATMQSLALSVRALREATLTAAMQRRRLGREMLIGLLLGTICGAVVALAAGFWTRSWPLALALGGSLAAGLVAAAGFGCLLPWILRSLRGDRWLASEPLARSLAGLLALFIYFGLACLLIRH